MVVPVNDLPDLASLTVDLPVPSRAMAVGAHADDIEFGCGGTFAKWAVQGCQLTFLVLTDGAKGSWDPSRDAASLVAARQSEQREAAARLGGGDVAFLGWIREEKVFASVAALVSRMHEDAREARSTLARAAETVFPEP